MGLQHKFGVAFFQLGLGLTILTPVISHALTLDPVNIDSSRGEPLYAEIPFREAQSTTPLKISIAQPFELGQVAVLDEAKYAHYNFYVRQNQQGQGVIIITSTRPINGDIIDLTLKIEDSGQTRMQIIRASLPSRIDRLKNSLNETPLKPRYVTNDQDLKLSLPEVLPIKNENQLKINTSIPPMMQKKATVQVANITPSPVTPSSVNATSQLAVKPQTTKQQDSQATKIATPNPPIIVSKNQSIQAQSVKEDFTSIPSPQGEVNINVSRRSAVQVTSKPETIYPTPQTMANIQPSTKQQPIAKATPRTKVDAKSNKPKPIESKPVIKAQPKQKIQNIVKTQKPNTPINPSNSTAKEKHKVQANESLWGIANQISKQENIPISQIMEQIQENNKHAFINGKANQLKQGAILKLAYEYQAAKPKQKVDVPKPLASANQIAKNQQNNAPSQAEKQSQAHMSIVAGDSKGATQGSKAKGTDKKVSNELTVQVKQQRITAVGLQNNVRKLDRELVVKENRIALLNARLAELEQQLKQKKKANTDSINQIKSNTNSRSDFSENSKTLFSGKPTLNQSTTEQELA
ncbi:hypothetical protein MKI79_05300 [Acinetobacter sp. A3.8]|uniref:LysM domain-containing protein n=1 Tax=Acinetobacter sedimenti TaxID=2919922 RepID=A0A9X2B645_9GAMM|nr:hypothetical protein [Acinetobacter sedimenti]MCJ8146318.1 hypothetical protein [Acinetobacter sedimenti]